MKLKELLLNEIGDEEFVEQAFKAFKDYKQDPTGKNNRTNIKTGATIGDVTYGQTVHYTNIAHKNALVKDFPNISVKCSIYLPNAVELANKEEK